MKNFQIRYSDKFAEHLESCLTDLSTKSQKAANKLRDDIKKKLLTLKSYPHFGPQISSPVERLNKYRKIVLIYDYLLFYFLDEKTKTIFVIDLIHGKQNYWHLLD